MLLGQISKHGLSFERWCRLTLGIPELALGISISRGKISRLTNGPQAMDRDLSRIESDH